MPEKEFFVKDGEPNVKIVVGANAPSTMDVVSAADIAVALGTLLYTEKEVQAEASAVVVKEDTAYDPIDIPVFDNTYVGEEDGDYKALADEEAWWNGSYTTFMYKTTVKFIPEMDRNFSTSVWEDLTLKWEEVAPPLHPADYVDESDLLGDAYLFDISDPDYLVEEGGYNVTMRSKYWYQNPLYIELEDVGYVDLTKEVSEEYTTPAGDEYVYKFDSGYIYDYTLKITEIQFDKDEWDILVEKYDKELPPKDISLVIPNGSVTITMDFAIYGIEYEDTDVSGGPVYDRWVDDSGYANYKVVTLRPGITVGDVITLPGIADDPVKIVKINSTIGDTGKTYAIVYGESYGTEYLKQGETYTFGDYKVTVLDIDVYDDKVLIQVEGPEGSELVILDASDIDKYPEKAEETLFEGGFYVNLKDTFVGIEGNLIAEVELASDLKGIKQGDTDFAPGWKITFGIAKSTEDLNGDGDAPDLYIADMTVTNSKDLKDDEINLLNKFVVDYRSNEYEYTDEAGDEWYAFESYIAIDPIIDGVVTEPVKTIEITEITEPITVLDEEVDLNAVDSNLILVGGPVANAITKYLVDQGLSTVDWENSDGEFEYLEDVFGEYDVLIVAGKDRYATREAAKELMQYLAAL